MDNDGATTRQKPPLSVHLDSRELTAQIQRAIRKSVFSSGLVVSPRRISQVGENIASGLFLFFDRLDEDAAQALGRQLAHDGLGPRSILECSEAIWRVCLEQSNLLDDFLSVVGAFTTAMLEGYMTGREERLLEVQERTHRAYLAALVRNQEESASVP